MRYKVKKKSDREKGKTVSQSALPDMRADDKFHLVLDPFDNENPIKYKGKVIHTFNTEELDNLLEEDVHGVLKQIFATLNHPGVGLSSVPGGEVKEVSEGMVLVLSHFERTHSAILSEAEKERIKQGKKKFRAWKAGRSKTH